MTELNNEFFEDLIKDTDFVIAKSGSLMNSRSKVTTPVLAINCIYGGGLPLGTISEISGNPGGGKSTFSYQCMANFQKEYPNGVPVVYDMESSMDDIRLRVLGVDTNKVLRQPATTLDSAFASMFTILNKLIKLNETESVPSLQIFDTISAAGTEKQHQNTAEGKSAFGAGSMMEAPRVIKQNLMNLFPYLEKMELGIMLLNQVFTQMSQFSSKLASGGGMGLKHAAHSHITFGASKDIYENGFLVGTQSMIKLEKSKLSPKIVEIPCYIDAREGGKIDEIDSFLRYITASNIGIVKTGAWYNFKDTISEMINRYPELDTTKLNSLKINYRKDDFYSLVHEEPDLLKLLMIALIDFINNIYPAQSAINSDYKYQLVSECSYFTDSHVDKEKEIVGDK